MSHSHRNQARLLLSSAALVGSLLGAGCAGGEPGEEPLDLERSEQALEQVYDGETLLLGVFFGRGPVAALLPEIWGKAPQSKAEAAEAFRANIGELERREDMREYDEQVLKLIEGSDDGKDKEADEVAHLAISRLVEQDPEFASHFQKGFYSGDPVYVSEVIKEAAERLAELIELELIKDPGRYGADWWINQNIAINENAAVNVNVAVNIDTAYNKTQFWSKVLDRESMLRNEIFVARFAERFAAARFAQGARFGR
jgi:SdpC family antimicrobial peptide